MRFLSHFSMAVALATVGSLALTAMPFEAQAMQKDPKKKQKKQKKQKGPKMSKEFRAAAGPVQKAIEANDPTAKTQVEALLAGPWAGVEADFAGQLAINLGAKLKDTGIQEKGINKRLDAGLLDPATKARMLYFGGSFARARGDFATAERQLKEAIAAGYAGPAAHLELANGYSAQKQHAKSLQYLSQAIDIQTKSGQAAPEDWYRASRDRALATKDNQLYSEWAAKWAEAYPSPTSWKDAITAYRFKTQTNTEQNLEVLRFMKASGALTQLRDYKEYAEEANKKSNFGEVVEVLEEGRLKGVVPAGDPIVSDLLAPNKGKITGDRASLPTAPSGVRGSGSASVMMNFADTWFGYKDYAKAIAFYQAGMTKAGADADRAHIGIGTSQAFAGDLDAAKAAFVRVSGARKPLANMWSTWIGQQTAPAVATSTATPTES